MGLRLLLLGPPAAWLPVWRGGRLVLGPSPSADYALERGPEVLVELLEGGVLVRPLGPSRGLTDDAGRAAPGSGLLVPLGGSFRLGSERIAVAEEAPLEPSGSGAGGACLVCGALADEGPSRRVAGAVVCTACTRRLDLPAGSCPGYELLARLGVGGFGVVYLAHERSRDRLVAVKAVRSCPDPAQGERARERLRREIEILARLDHPSILRLLDARMHGDTTYLVSEFVPGGDARARLERVGRFRAGEVARIGASLCEALAYAHAREIVHRDVKPENVLLGLDGRARLIDFGLAKQLSGLFPLTSTGTGLGTVLYASPEQIEDGRAVSPAADVWSLAATLFHLATGFPPRQAKRGSPLGELLQARPGRADQLVPAVPAALGQLLEACFARDPGGRPGARELGARLGGLGGSA